MNIQRIVVAQKNGTADVYTIYNLEMPDGVQDIKVLNQIFCNSEIEHVIGKMPGEEFLEVMYHNGVIDPQQESIIIACDSLGIKVEAAKVSHRYYGNLRDTVFVNKLVHMSFTDEPHLETLRPRGKRNGMQLFDLTAMSDDVLVSLSKSMKLSLSLRQMQELVEIQKDMGLPNVTDVFLETFAARWSDHCFHTKWKALGLFEKLQSATKEINNPNLLSAFVDNAGVWKFFAGLAIALKLETHNSPTQKEPYGGQLTKLGGVIRDILENGLGAKPIGSLEMTVVGEYERKHYPEFEGKTLSAKDIARETIRAISDYGNRMGIPMLLARMFSHPAFSGKVFALGGTVGITTETASKKGKPEIGDFAVLVGGWTGNDGLHGATVSSGGINEETDTGDSCHVQIGNPFPEQKMMRAGLEIRDKGCVSARNDFGAAGIISAVGELGELVGDNGGVLVNLALVPLKCVGMDDWQIALSESQERVAHAVKLDKLNTAMEIYSRYGLEATVIGVFTGNGNLQVVHDPKLTQFTAETSLSGEVAINVPYSHFDRCPLPTIEVVTPPQNEKDVKFPEINLGNIQAMAGRVVRHFDVCNQAVATTQYDSTVQGITLQGPLYGKKHNVGSSLAVLKPVFGKEYGITVSKSFSPWQFEVDPIKAAVNAVLDAIATQVIAGVDLHDICLSDNFYTPDQDPYAYYYLSGQVESISRLSIELGTPFITGKDSSSGSGTFGGVTANVLSSVAITAMGKIEDVNKLKLHQWKSPKNFLFLVGPMAKSISGSILASSLSIAGGELSSISLDNALKHMEGLSRLASSGIVQSAVPINRGGVFLRLFEGVETSGFGIETALKEELFRESFGSVLVEIKSTDVNKFLDLDPDALLVGQIVKGWGINVCGEMLDWQKLHTAWNTTFGKEVYR